MRIWTAVAAARDLAVGATKRGRFNGDGRDIHPALHRGHLSRRPPHRPGIVRRDLGIAQSAVRLLARTDADAGVGRSSDRASAAVRAPAQSLEMKLMKSP